MVSTSKQLLSCFLHVYILYLNRWNQPKENLPDGPIWSKWSSNRILLSALPDSMGIMHYHYADELLSYILFFKVLTVPCFVFTTPLSLLCCLPIIFTLKKVWNTVNSACVCVCVCGTLTHLTIECKLCIYMTIPDSQTCIIISWQAERKVEEDDIPSAKQAFCLCWV